MNSQSPNYETIAYEVDHQVATITLNRPDRLNAFNTRMRDELLAVFDEIDADDDVRAVIVTGAGRGFCAGADLEAGGDTFDGSARGRDPEVVNRDGGGLVTLRIFELTKPIIAAINGPAVGVGVTMTLPMDVRLAGESARIGFVFARRGIVPEACSSWFLPRVVGISQAAQWCYSGRVFDAAEAGRGGLVEVVPDDQLLDRAREIATEIAVHAAPVSVALTRHMLWRGLTFDHPMQAHRADSRAIQGLGKLADAREGVTSFLEKRDPEWTMKPSQDTPDAFPFWDEREFS
ncbi:MAG: crotonase/enoyl-CoA hydratase family protein [Acidimicrobiales bacterium]